MRHRDVARMVKRADDRKNENNDPFPPCSMYALTWLSCGFILTYFCKRAGEVSTHKHYAFSTEKLSWKNFSSHTHAHDSSTRLEVVSMR